MIASLCMCLAGTLIGPVTDRAAGAHASAPLSLPDSLEAQGAPGRLDYPSSGPNRNGPRQGAGPVRWRDGQTLMQGYFGVLLLEEIARGGGGTPPVDGSDDNLSRMPTIGGGAMYKLGGEHLDWGVEGMLGLSGRANATAIYVGGGGAAVAVDVNLLVIDLYGGPFVSLFLGDKLRMYGAAGPLMQWANFDQKGSSVADTGSGNGFGVGGYLRGGVEVLLGSGTLVGLGARWSESDIDLGGGMGNLRLGGLQTVLTVTTGL